MPPSGLNQWRLQWLARSKWCGYGLGRRVPDPARQAARVCGGLGFEDADENPAGRPINRYEEVAARGLIGHLRQVFHVDVEVSRLVSLEGAVLRLLFLGREIAQVSHAFAIVARTNGATMAHRRRQRSKPEREAFGFRNSRSEPLKAPLVQAQWRAPAGRPARPAASCTRPPQRLPALASTSFAGGAACGCGRERCRGGSIYKPSAQ